MKKINLLLIFILLLPVVLAGVTNPLPTELELLKAEEGRFKFQIQNLNRPVPISCEFELQGDSPMKIEFDDDSVIVDANSKQDFLGTVKAPKTYGRYVQEFCVRCIPVDEASGASVRIDSCGLPVAINVVSSRTIENMTVENILTQTWAIALVLVAVLALGMLVYKHEKHKIKNKLSKK